MRLLLPEKSHLQDIRFEDLTENIRGLPGAAGFVAAAQRNAEEEEWNRRRIEEEEWEEREERRRAEEKT